MNKEVFNIFYADDDYDDREFFKDALAEISDSVTLMTQKDGKELIEMLRNSSSVPNILFLDLNMPVKNGYEVLKELKQSEHTKNIPVIIFSTSDHSEAIKTTRQLGARLYVPKPSSYSTLKKVIMHTIAINWDQFYPSTEEFVLRVN